MIFREYLCHLSTWDIMGGSGEGPECLKMLSFLENLSQNGSILFNLTATTSPWIFFPSPFQNKISQWMLQN